MDAVAEKTTKEEQRIAQSSVSKVQEAAQKAMRMGSSSVKINIHEGGEALIIPKRALSFLFDIVRSMAEGKSIILMPSDTEVSTQQAAHLLHVSRPHVVKLLEKGEIPFRRVGTHRRIEIKYIVAYQKKLKEKREEKLGFLAKQAQELNLGY